jgi:hypothetical protein
MKSVRGLFFLAGIIAGLILFFYYWMVLCGWLGRGLGTLVAVFVAPGVVVFPFVYWVIQGAFPIFYFELLGVCLVSAFAIVWSVER